MVARILRRFLADQSGATAIEYALLGTMIGVAVVASFTVFGEALGNMFGSGTGGAADVIARQIDKMN